MDRIRMNGPNRTRVDRMDRRDQLGPNKNEVDILDQSRLNRSNVD